MTQIRIVFALTLILLAPATEAASRPPAPEARTYFTILLGLDRALPAATCLTFGPEELCTGDGLCGSWRWTVESRRNRRQASFSFELALVDDEGTRIHIDGVGRLDARGPGSTIAAAARVSSENDRINFGLVGRPADPARCVERAREFNRRVEGLVE